MIIKILKTNKKVFNGKFENAGSHYYIYFKCKECGTEDKKQKRRFKDSNELLCRKCLKNKVMLEKYGFKIASKNNEVRNKIRKASIKNESLKKMKNKMKKKYGTDNASKIEKFVNKRQKTKRLQLLPNLDIIFKNNNIKRLFTDDEYIGQRLKDINVKYEFKCLLCNKDFLGTLNGHIPRCPKCFNHNSFSENELKDFIYSLNLNLLENCKNIISPYELDVYIPEKKIAIEFNGLYWHSELNGKDKFYHLNKTNLCNEKGIKLIHIFEDEWINKKEIVKSIIKSKLGIHDKKVYARKCTVELIDNKKCSFFLEKNHIQGNCVASIRLGLFFNNELISVMTFSKSRFSKYNYEMIRFCNKLNYKILGGASKLFKRFDKEGTLVSYCDLRYFEGIVYEKLNLKLKNISKPNYFYLKNNKRENRIKYQKHKLKNLLEIFDESLSEWENMKLNGYDRIWDCGNKVFVLN